MKSLIPLLKTSALLHLAIVCMLVLYITVPGIEASELFVNGDEARHAMTGVYFRDLIHDFPITSPKEYTFRYYAHYPALGLIHWPPLFHMAEGVFFAVFGISVVTARLCVIAFSLLLAVYFYRLVRDLFDAPTACLASILLICTAAVVSYARVVMLEIPSLALCVVSIFQFNRYLSGRGQRYAVRAAATLALAALTRQHALLLVPLFITLALILGQARILLRREVLLSGLAAMAVVVPYYAYTFQLHGQSVANDALSGARGHEFLMSTRNLTYYLEMIPKQAGWIVPSLAAVSIVVALARKCRASRVFAAWIVVCYVLFTAIAQKDSRYVIYWLPPMCAMAAYGLFATRSIVRLRRPAAVGLVGVAVLSIVGASRIERPYVRGCLEAVQHVASVNGTNPIFFQGELNGSFIFHVRATDTERRSLVLRGSKMIFVTNILNAYGQEQLIGTPEDLFQAFDRNAVRCAVVEDRDILNAPGYEMLINALESDRFQPSATVPIETNVERFADLKLKIYEYKEARAPKDLTVILPMRTLDEGIEVKVE